MNQSRLLKLWSYLRPHWRQVLLGIFTLLLVNLLGVYIPLLIRNGVDKLKGNFGYEDLVRYVVLILVLASIMWVIRMLSRISLFGVGRQVEVDLKQRVFEHLLGLEPAYFATHGSGDLMSRATSDLDNIRRLLGFAVLSLVNTIFAYGLTLPVMLTIDAHLSLMAIAVYPLMLITVQLFSGKLRQQQLEVQEKIGELSELVQEDMSGISLIKIYAQEENECLAFNKKNNKLLNASLKLARTRSTLFPIIQGMASISLFILLWIGSGDILRNKITIGDFIALIIYVERLVFPTALLGFTLTAYQQGQVSIDRVESIFNVKPKIKDDLNPISLPTETVKGEIEIKDLTYSYPGANRPSLNRVNLTIRAGETVAIVGPIGSGKSTFANALPRLLDIEPGQIFLDGKDITKIKLTDLRRAIAYVPQESFLFSATIQNNIRYAQPFLEQPEIEYAAKQAQIHPEILNFPQQYETLVGERGITLSGGQRQRTSLARALVVDAPILILDDALSSVDNQTATQILDNLATEKGKTIIFISHQLSAAATADRILVMDEGKIVQMGNHQELLETPGLYQSLWQQNQLEELLK